MNHKKIWPYLDVRIRGSGVDIYLSLCWEYGASGIHEDCPEKDWYRVYFQNLETCIDAELQLSNRSHANNETIDIVLGSIADIGWESAWHEFFKPVYAGKNFLILPVWEPVVSSERRIIRIDPGQAFGTGNHETTAMSLELLEIVRVSECDVLDAGCGSGILGIAAVKCGAHSVTGIDIQASAVVEAARNAYLNGVAPHCRFLKQNLELSQGVYDVVMANLNVELLTLKPNLLSDRLEDNAQVIVSGFLASQTSNVLTALAKTSELRVDRIIQKGEWAAAYLVRGNR